MVEVDDAVEACSYQEQRKCRKTGVSTGHGSLGITPDRDVNNQPMRINIKGIRRHANWGNTLNG